MALAKRIIPCLDIKDGKTVKGINFENIRDMGDPVELAAYYAAQGADELVFLDITATNDGRKTFAELVYRIASEINIPFTVGGGINAIEDVDRLLSAGADKISLNTAAYRNPNLVTELANKFGSQCVVVAIDTKIENDDWFVYLNGGRIPAGVKTLDWARRVTELGAGELLLTSINSDGTKRGFALEHTRQVSAAVNVPVIASGGAGSMQHFADVLSGNIADAALAASVFHAKQIMIPDLKQYLQTQNITVRI